MSIEFTDKSYILGIWYTETQDGLVNYLTAFWKENDKWIGRRRKRMVKGDKVFESDDVKEWQEMTPNKPDMDENEIIEMMNKIGQLAIICGMRTDMILVQGNVDKFLELSKTKDWMHIKSEFIH